MTDNEITITRWMLTIKQYPDGRTFPSLSPMKGTIKQPYKNKKQKTIKEIATECSGEVVL